MQHGTIAVSQKKQLKGTEDRRSLFSLAMVCVRLVDLLVSPYYCRSHRLGSLTTAVLIALAHSARSFAGALVGMTRSL